MATMNHSEVLARATRAYGEYVRAQDKVNAYEKKILGQIGHELRTGQVLANDITYAALCGRRNGHQDAFRTNAQMAMLMSSTPGAFILTIPD